MPMWSRTDHPKFSAETDLPYATAPDGTDRARRTAMAISDGSGGAPTRVDALPEIDKRGVSRRSVLVGGAALLVGAGLMKPARALAAGPTGSASGTMGAQTFGLSAAQQIGRTSPPTPTTARAASAHRGRRGRLVPRQVGPGSARACRRARSGRRAV